MTYISLKLPAHVVTVSLPPITTTAQAVDVPAASIRVTRGGNTRVTRGGNIRVTHYGLTCYPEIVAVKINNPVVNVHIGEA